MVIIDLEQHSDIHMTFANEARRRPWRVSFVHTLTDFNDANLDRRAALSPLGLEAETRVPLQYKGFTLGEKQRNH